MIARALGAAVYKNREKELGWGPLLLTAAGRASPVRHLAAEHTFMLHWHGDTFDLPAGATLVSSITDSIGRAGMTVIVCGLPDHDTNVNMHAELVSTALGAASSAGLS